MNRKLTSHIQYGWFVYLILAVIIVVMWCSVFNIMAQPKNNEKVSIIFYSEGWDSTYLALHLQENKHLVTSQPLKKVSTEQSSVNKTLLFSSIGIDMIANDIMIIEQSLLADDGKQSNITINVAECFYQLDMEKLNALFGDMQVDYVMVDGKAYGFYLNNPNDDITNNFERFYKGQDTFLMFFSRETVNIDQMNRLGNKGDSAAIDFVKYLLETSDE